MERDTIARDAREKLLQERVFVFGPGLKWLIVTIIHVISPVSYAVAFHDG